MNMIARLYNALAIVSIATMLALGGFSAYLCGSGRLNAERLETFAAALRGELDQTAEDAPAAQADEDREAWDSPWGRSDEELRAASRQDHLHYQMIERAMRDLQAQKRLLDQTLHYVINEQERLAQEKDAWTRQQERLTSDIHDAGTRRELELVGGLPPKQAKEHIISVWNRHKPDAVALVMQLDVSKTKRIFAQMKTPQEQQIMSELLEQLRIQEPEGAANESGTTAGDATP